MKKFSSILRGFSFYVIVSSLPQLCHSRPTATHLNHPIVRKKLEARSAGRVNPNFRINSHGWTALHQAAQEGDVEKIHKLVARGANVDVKDNYGFTPLHVAANKPNNPKAINALLGHGADINAQDNEGETPLHESVGQYHHQNMNLLLEKKANPNIKDSDGQTPLHMASWNDHNKLSVKALIDHGADPNIQDSEGRTPLHLASSRDEIHAVKVLLENNANPNLESSNGNTALHVSTMNPGTVKTLLEHGANPNIQNLNGATPLDMADTNEYTTQAQTRAILIQAGGGRYNERALGPKDPVPTYSATLPPGHRVYVKRPPPPPAPPLKNPPIYNEQDRQNGAPPKYAP